jgi:opacity protein-like surface antigen
MAKRVNLCVSLVGVASVGASAAAGVLDQHNEGPLLGGTSVGVIGTAFSQSASQTISVGLGGVLDRVEVYAYAIASNSHPLVLEIQGVVGGLPDGTVLGTQQVLPQVAGLQWISFDLTGLNVNVTAAQHLALVFRSSQDLSQGEYDVEGSHDVYGGGASFYRSISGPWIQIPDYDLMFRTYVESGGGSCTADFNHDGDVGTDDDIEAFFACLAGSCCAACGSADFNGDGDTGTDADIESFFRVLAGGPC